MGERLLLQVLVSGCNMIQEGQFEQQDQESEGLSDAKKKKHCTLVDNRKDFTSGTLVRTFLAAEICHSRHKLIYQECELIDQCGTLLGVIQMHSRKLKPGKFFFSRLPFLHQDSGVNALYVCLYSFI